MSATDDDDTPTPERVTLTDEERSRLVNDLRDAGWSDAPCSHPAEEREDPHDTRDACWGCRADWLAAREQALREEIAPTQGETP